LTVKSISAGKSVRVVLTVFDSTSIHCERLRDDAGGVLEGLSFSISTAKEGAPNVASSFMCTTTDQKACEYLQMIHDAVVARFESLCMFPDKTVKAAFASVFSPYDRFLKPRYFLNGMETPSNVFSVTVWPSKDEAVPSKEHLDVMEDLGRHPSDVRITFSGATCDYVRRENKI